MSDENGSGTQIIESEKVVIEDMPKEEDIEVKNPRIGRVLKLQEEAEQQNELERQRGRRIRQQQIYIDRMIASVEENLKNTKEEQAYNEAFERRIQAQVYRMHGISEDKLMGMTEARRSWQQGAAFALFFLSLMMIVLCGALHGFGSEICIFMAFFTAIEGTLLSNGKKQHPILDGLIKVLYLLLFPAMMVIFVCYELGFEEYGILLPYFTAAGVLILVLGAVSYFLYDPYREDRRSRRKADGYLKEMERAAAKEVWLKEKAYAKQEKKKERKAARREKKERWKERWTAVWKREKDDAQPYSAAGEPAEDTEESPVKTEPPAEPEKTKPRATKPAEDAPEIKSETSREAQQETVSGQSPEEPGKTPQNVQQETAPEKFQEGPEKPTPREAQPSGTELDSPEGIG